MTDNDQPIDGYSDATPEEVQAEGNAAPDSADPGRNPAAPPPLSPEEYERLKEEARSADDRGNSGATGGNQ